MIDVTISLVSFNQRHDLEHLLPSLLQATSQIRAEILLIDNRSTDKTYEFVSHNYPMVAIFKNLNKAGYGKNHNINLKRARGRYFVIMNSDMLVSQDVFSSLLDFMEKHEKIGIVSPKILNEDGTVQGLNKRYPTLLDLFLRRFCPKAFQTYFKERLDYYEMRDIGYDHIYDVPFLSGSFMFCRTNLLKSIGSFNPSFFLYFEDADLCRRVQRTHRTVYYPYVSINHFWKRAAHNNLIYTLYFIRSAVIYFRKWGFRLY